MMITILVLLSGLFVYPVVSSLSNNVVITSSGQIVSPNVNAASGSARDIQAAIDLIVAHGGIGNVYIPAGTFDWNGETVNIPTGVSVYGASLAGCDGHESNWTSYTATTILRNAVNSGSMFHVDGTGRTVKSCRISGIQFEVVSAPEGSTQARGISVYRGIDVRIDHCTFINFQSSAVMVSNSDDNLDRVLIDHCVVDNPYKDTYGGIWGYGFYVGGAVQPRDSGFQPYTDAYWGDAQDIYGRWDTAPSKFAMMYVEDCHLSRCRHDFDAIQGGFFTARYNLIDKPYPTNYGMIDIHGTESAVGGTQPSYIGGRGFEAYNNVIVSASGGIRTAGVWCRGGSALVYNNVLTCDTYDSYNTLTEILNDDGANLYPKTQVTQTYIWNNEVTGGTLFRNSGGYVENVDYFLRAPNQQQDGFTYTPYPYPHPLTLKVAP